MLLSVCLFIHTFPTHVMLSNALNIHLLLLFFNSRLFEHTSSINQNPLSSPYSSSSFLSDSYLLLQKGKT
jgi:hypothetical protein